MIRKLESISPANAAKIAIAIVGMNIAMAVGVGIAAETIAQPETIAIRSIEGVN